MSTPARDRLRLAESGAAEVLDEDGERVDALTLARTKLRLPNLRRVVKRGRTDSLFDLELEDGTVIEVGQIAALKDPRALEDRLALSTGILPPYYAPKTFRPVANALLAIAELEDDGITPESTTCGWLVSFLEDRTRNGVDLTDDAERVRVVTARAPFRAIDGRLFIPLEGIHGFERFVTGALRQRTGSKDLGARLARLGFQRTQVSGPRPERKRASFHASPVGFDPEDHA